MSTIYQMFVKEISENNSKYSLTEYYHKYKISQNHAAERDF